MVTSHRLYDCGQTGVRPTLTRPAPLTLCAPAVHSNIIVKIIHVMFCRRPTLYMCTAGPYKETTFEILTQTMPQQNTIVGLHCIMHMHNKPWLRLSQKQSTRWKFSNIKELVRANLPMWAICDWKEWTACETYRPLSHCLASSAISEIWMKQQYKFGIGGEF